ncbi:MAG TPA: hypothetical protein VGM03_19275, partial [Phycisphaerae bacterium]
STESLKSAIDCLQDETIESDDPYLLEGGLELVAQAMLDLIGPDARPELEDAPLSDILHYIAAKYQCGGDAEGAARELESALSTFWYDDLDSESMAHARDELVHQLTVLVDAIEPSSART